MSTLKDKREPWSYIMHGHYDITPLKRMAQSFQNEWEQDTSRQNTYQTHRDTKCISIIKMDYEWKIGSPVLTTTDNSIIDEVSMNALNQIISNLENKINGKTIRLEIVSMDPFSRIRTHKDRSDISYLARRIHIPLITNQNIFFTVNGNTVNMEEGLAYEINNIKWHSVLNRSNEKRIHIIIDILPMEFYTNGAKNDE